MSDPIPIGEHRADISAASPPELPPGVLFLSQGFNALPHKGLTV